MAVSYGFMLPTGWPTKKRVIGLILQLFIKLCSFFQMMSDLLYRAPSDKITKMLINEKVPVYMYVLNTTVEAFRLPEWRKVPHDTELYFLTGAPFMDTGGFSRNEVFRIFDSFPHSQSKE